MGKYLLIKGADFSNDAVKTVTPIMNLVSISVQASPEGGGTVTGGGLYSPGDSVQITATASEGYVFQKWSDDNTNATRTITVVDVPQTYVAIFARNTLVKVGELPTSTMDAAQLGDSVVHDSRYGIYIYEVGAIQKVHIEISGFTNGGYFAWCQYSAFDGTSLSRNNCTQTGATLTSGQPFSADVNIVEGTNYIAIAKGSTSTIVPVSSEE